LKEHADKTLLYPGKLIVPKSRFATPAAAFATYLFGALLLVMNSPVASFLILSFALTLNIFDAYTFPFLNGLFGKRESFVFGAAGNAAGNEVPEAVLFLSPHSGNAARIRNRALYRLGFLGGVTLFLASIVSLVKVPLHPSLAAAGSALSAVGLFSHGLYRNEKSGEPTVMKKLITVAEALAREEGSVSWIILLTDLRFQATIFLAKYRRYLITRPCFFLRFDDALGEDVCVVERSPAILTGYRTHPRLTRDLGKIAAGNGLQVRIRKRGLDLNCLCALARGYRAASLTFSSHVAEPVLLDSLKKINALQYMRGSSG
jgi:hypothetical protein